MLDSHPNISCGPESELFLVGVGGGIPPAELARRFDFPQDRISELKEQCSSLAEFTDRFLAEYAGATGKRRWAEKTPKNVAVLDYIFAHFPKAQFVHVIRDGRDVVCSLRRHPQYKLVNGQMTKCHTDNPIRICIERWVRDVRAGLAYRDDPRYCEVRYEDLVSDTEQTLRRLLAFLGEPWDEKVMAFHTVKSASRDVEKFPHNPEATQPLSSSSIGRWRVGLTRTEAAFFKALAGTLLCQLGYAADDRWEPDGTYQSLPAVPAAS
jgi:hypothetical protein